LIEPVGIDEGYVFAGEKRRERDSRSRSRRLSTRGSDSYDSDKPSVFIHLIREPGQRYVIPAKAADESTIRLLLVGRQQESLTVYTDGFRACDPLEEDDPFNGEYVVHGDGEYTDEEVHVNTYESHA
jgi:transposase-like protein